MFVTAGKRKTRRNGPPRLQAGDLGHLLAADILRAGPGRAAGAIDGIELVGAPYSAANRTPFSGVKVKFGAAYSRLGGVRNRP